MGKHQTVRLVTSCHGVERDCRGTLRKRLIAEIKAKNLTPTLNKVLEK